MEDLSTEKMREVCLEALQVKTELLEVIPRVAKKEATVLQKQLEIVELTKTLISKQRKLREAKSKRKEQIKEDLAPCLKKRKLDADARIHLNTLNDQLADLRVDLTEAEMKESTLRDCLSAVQCALQEVRKCSSTTGNEMNRITWAKSSLQAQELPPDVLVQMFHRLNVYDLLTVGQVCDRWRQISRSNLGLWREKSVSVRTNGYDKYIRRGPSRVLMAAPLLGEVSVCKNSVSLLKGTDCKVLGLSFDSETTVNIIGALKRHSKHLESLKLSVIKKRVLQIIDKLTLKQLIIDVHVNDETRGFQFSGPLVEESRLVKLTVHMELPALAALIRAHAATLEEVKLLWVRHRYDGFSVNTKGRKEIAAALADCQNLNQLVVPCESGLDFSSLAKFRVKRLLVDTSSCCWYGEPHSAARFAFPPPHSVEHVLLKLHSLNDCASSVREHIQRFMKPSFRASLQSFQLEADSLPLIGEMPAAAGPLEAVQALMDEVPEFIGKYKIRRTSREFDFSFRGNC